MERETIRRAWKPVYLAKEHMFSILHMMGTHGKFHARGCRNHLCFRNYSLKGLKLKERSKDTIALIQQKKNAFKDLSGNVELSSVGSLRNSIRDQNLCVIYLDEHQNRLVRQASDRGQMQELSDYNEN